MNAHESYRIENKGNVNRNGKKTSFHVFKKNGDKFIFDGNYFAPGWNQSDEKCIEFCLNKDDDNA